MPHEDGVEKECPTALLEDVPAEVDSFASEGDVGPHFRVAKAIADLVVNASGGKVVAIEGGWGAGKSTVVTIARALLSQNTRPNITEIISFDAWAHKGDPLRRTYLETLICALRDRGWVARADWDNRLEEIASRRKTSRTQTVPKPTSLGASFALSVLLVPLGVAFMTAALRDALTIDLSEPISWKFVIGLLSVAPLLVVVTYAISLFAKGGVQRVFDLGQWAFLEGRAITSTETETIESPNPTSLEFERYFESLMKEALGGNVQRRVVLVLDNLDRVEPKDALEIWSTLQTFLQHHQRRAEAWFKQLWVWVPFDPIGIRKIWSEGGNESDAHDVSSSFLDKSFQIRFSVPPLVVSDWRGHLNSLLNTALPRHPAEDQHSIYTVFGQFRLDAVNPPTPRRLKLFVNQIGSIHRQWGDTFPIAHVAYFVLLCQDRRAFIRDLLEARVPSEPAIRLLGASLRDSLAGLVFNVSAARGREVLLAEPIYAALSTGQAEALEKLATDHRAGFWLILEQVAHARFHGHHGASLSQIAATFRRSGLLSREAYRPEVRAVREALISAADTVSPPNWGPIDKIVTSGVGALAEFGHDVAFTRRLIAGVSSILAAPQAPDKAPIDYVELQPALIELLVDIETMGQGDALPRFLTLQTDVKVWERFCIALTDAEPHGKFWDRFRPNLVPTDLCSALVSNIGNGNFSTGTTAIVKVMNRPSVDHVWRPFFDSIRDRLDSNKQIPSAESIQLLYGLDQLRETEIVQAAETLEKLIQEGHLLHQFLRATKESNHACRALCLYLFVKAVPDVSRPAVSGTAEQGYQRLSQALESEEDELVEALTGLVQQHTGIEWIFSAVLARGRMDPLLGKCIRMVASKGTNYELFSAEILAKHWPHISNTIDSSTAESMLKSLSSSGLQDRLRLGQEQISTSSASLCSTLLQVVGGDTSFLEWCAGKLSKLSLADWSADIRTDFACSRLASDIRRKGGTPFLGIAFHDSLLQYATDLADGKTKISTDFSDLWSSLIDCIHPDSVRNMFPKRLLRLMTSRNGEVSDEFIVLCGGILCDWSILQADEELIPRVFTNWLMADKIVGLMWMVRVFSDVPELWKRDAELASSEEFGLRLQSRVDHPLQSAGDEHVRLIAELAPLKQSTSGSQLRS